MDIVSEIIPELIDKKQIASNIWNIFITSIFEEKLKESHAFYLRKLDCEPFIRFSRRNFEMKLYIPDRYDEYNTHKPARVYFKSIKGVIPCLKLLLKIYTCDGIIQKPIELFDLAQAVNIVSIPEIPYLSFYRKNGCQYQSVSRIDIYEVNCDGKTFLNMIYPTYFHMLNEDYKFRFGQYWNMQFIENEKERMCDKIKFAHFFYKNFHNAVSFIYWTRLYVLKYKRRFMIAGFIVLFSFRGFGMLN